jgi:hypothetical protein
LDEFVIIYIDDILMYSKTIEEHAKDLEYVLTKFRENKLFAEKTKESSLPRKR